eukprot:10564415-Ditylum_brightwellii.AAC.1
MKIPYHLIPEKFKKEYNLDEIVQDDDVYVEIHKGMYGLPQAGKIANDQLIKHLAKLGYSPVHHTPGLWKHKDRDIPFCIVHLIKALQQLYTITIDRKGNLFCGITLRWDYTNRTVDLSIPGYIRAALEQFKHPISNIPEHALHTYTRPQYKSGPQMAPLEQ